MISTSPSDIGQHVRADKVRLRVVYEDFVYASDRAMAVHLTVVGHDQRYSKINDFRFDENDAW